MILYVDTSALVKKYVAETGSDVVNQAIGEAKSVGMTAVGRVEAVAAFSKAMRMGVLTPDEGKAILKLFYKEWSGIAQIGVTDAVVARAEAIAWEHQLRGYDAVHLASALLWQEMLAEPVTMAVFDRKLWETAALLGLTPFPDKLGDLGG